MKKNVMFVVYLLAIVQYSPFILKAQYGRQHGYVQNESTLSPRFFITKGTADKFPLALTEIKANVVGMIADVSIRQVYVNNGNDPIEAVYVFPASTKAAVYGMKMQIADRVITAIVKEKQQARVDYEKAKSDGKSASLLEELAPNVFRMNVANILKGDSIIVTINYTEMLIPEDNVYRFVYPAVVGPRYVTAGSNTELINALNEQTDSRIMPGQLKFEAKVSTPVPLKSLKSPSHKMDIVTKDNKTGRLVQMGRNNSLTTMTLSPKDEFSGARDIVFEYVLAGPEIESGLLLHEGKNENYFMLMVQPPTDIVIKNLMPREYIFIVDVSGSMNGFPLETAKSMMSELMTTMRPIDKMNVMMFSGGQNILSPQSLPATDENKEKVRSFFNNGYGGGGTELLPALRKAFQMETDDKISRTFVILTDGYVTVEREAFELIRTQLNKANVYSFGIGTSVNRWLIEGMARAGKGNSFVVMNPNETKKTANKFISYIQSPVLSHINVDYGDLDVYDLDMPSIPDVTGKRPIVVYGKWKGKKTGNVTLKGDAANGALTFTSSVEAAPSLTEHSALRYLWAKNKIIILDDEQQAPAIAQAGKPTDYKQVITDLGLKYNLLTKYTSFIAIDENIRVKKQVIDSLQNANNVIRQRSGEDNTKITTEPIQQGVALSAGVQADGVGLIVRGSRSESTQIKVDGLDIGDQFTDGLRTGATVSNFGVEDVKVQPGAFGAEYGNALGGVVNTVVKTTPAETQSTQQKTSAEKTTENKGTASSTGTGASSSSTTQSTTDSGSGSTTTGTEKSAPPSGTTQTTQPTTTTTETTSTSSSSSGGGFLSSIFSSGSRYSNEDDLNDPLAPRGARLPRIYGGIVGLMGNTWITDETFASPFENKSVELSEKRFKLSYSLGVEFDYILGNPKDAASSILTSVLYSRSNSANEASESAQLRTGANTAKLISTTGMDNLQLQLMYRWNIPDMRLGLMGGISTSFLLSSSREVAVAAGDSIVIMDGNQQVLRPSGTILYSGEIPNVRNFQAGFVLGIGYEIPLKRFLLVPQIRATYNLTTLRNDERLWSWQAGISLRMAF